MKQLTQSEIGRTAFPWKDPSNFTSTFGRTHPLRVLVILMKEAHSVRFALNMITIQNTMYLKEN